MVLSKKDALKVLGLTCLAVAIILTGILDYSPIIHEHRLESFWYVVYGVAVLFILHKLKRGELFHPITIVISAYFLILILGTVTYGYWKKFDLEPLPFNLINIGLLSMLLGILLGENLYFIKDRFYQPAIGNPLFHYILAAMGVAALFTLFIKAGTIPMFAPNPNYAKTMILAGNGYLNLFFKGMHMFVLSILFTQLHGKKDLTYVHVFFLFTLCITLMAGHRAKSLIYLGQYLVLYLFFTGKRIPLRIIIPAGLVVVLFLSFWGSFRRGNSGLEGALTEFEIVVVHRPFMVDAVIRNFDTDDLFNGSLYYTDFQRFLPGTESISNVELKYIVFNDPKALPEINGLTPSLVGEAYLNFGQYGPFWVILIVGFIQGFLYKLFKNKPAFIICGFYLTTVFHVADSIQTGLGLKLVHLTQSWFWVIVYKGIPG
jgi:oligosaccharide repeat unit polymerase